jgi:hypothetical protein
MKNKKIKLAVYVFSIGILLLIFNGSIRWWQDQINPSQQICDNLLEAKYFNSQNECVISDEITNFLPAVFPIGETEVSDLEVGLRGFELEQTVSGTVSEAPCNGYWERFFYRIDTGILDSYLVRFTFCNDILINITYSE